VVLEFTIDERETLAEIRRAGGFRSDEDAVRGALFWYARFLDIGVSQDIFALALPYRGVSGISPRAQAPEPDPDAGDQGDLLLELP